MCDYVKEEIFLEEIPNLDLVKEEVKIEENQDVDVVVKKESENAPESYRVDKPHKCDVCSKTFKTKGTCSIHHLEMHSGAAQFACELCGRRYGRKSRLKEHMKRHGKERNYKCAECGSAFKTKGDLTKHISILHPTETPFQCEVCSKSFSTLSLLRSHSAVHAKEKPYKCDLCSVTCLRKISLDNHKAIVHDEKKFKVIGYAKEHKCDECGYASNRRGNLNKHIKIMHPTETPFRCEMCPKGFATLSLLSIHSVKHSEEKPYKCDQCAVAYGRKASLDNHKAVAHSDCGRFPCKVCGKKFMGPANFKEHMERHSQVKNHKCGECRSAFKTNRDLRRHITELHPIETPFRCEVCPKSFPKLALLRTHSLNHSEEKPFKCDQCSSAYTRKTTLNAHRATVHENEGSFLCEVCGKKFTLRSQLEEHAERHGKEKNHKCAECGCAFKTKGDLTKHGGKMHPTEAISHDGDKPYKCDRCAFAGKRKFYLDNHKAVVHDGGFPCGLCGKKFLVRSRLKEHTQRHSQDRNHSCVECGRTFKLKADLTIHINTMHPAETPYRCKVCPKSFSKLSLLKMHSQHHGEGKTHKCDLCPNAFKLKKHLNYHKAIRHGAEGSFPCKLCAKKFALRERLRAHLRWHGKEKDHKCAECGYASKKKWELSRHIGAKHPTEAPFRCEVCSKSFTKSSILEMHLMTHSDERPFKCDLCSSEFKSIRYVNQHKTRVHGAPRNQIVSEVKVEPVVIYDPEEKLVLADMGVEIKPEPVEMDENQSSSSSRCNREAGYSS